MSVQPAVLRQQAIKVAMVVSKGEPSLGGTQKQALRLANELHTLGVSVFVLSKRKKRRYEQAPDELRNQVQIVLLPVSRLKSAWTFLFSFLVWAWIHRRSFQIIHAHNASMGVMSAIVGSLVGKKVIVKIPSLKYVNYLRGGNFSGKLRRWILTRKTDRFIAVSTEMQQALMRAGIAREKLELIGNGIELNAPLETETDTLKNELSAQRDATVVLFVGRLVKEKGLDRLLMVWASLPERERMILLIVGDGPLRESLQRQAENLGLLSSVRFLGHQADVMRFYSIADLFVLPSRTEGMSNSLLEAMAAGLPVVASNVGGNKDVIKHQQTGFLVDWDDGKACARTLTRLSSDSELRRLIGNAARTQIRAFDIGNVAERYYDLYQTVLQE